jgi:hypothetical protein
LEILTFVEIDVPLTPPQTFRFTFPQEDLHFDAIPALRSVSVSPSVVDPGSTVGQRASVSVSIKDFQYPLDGTDFDKGTFFGKLRARKRSLQGAALRVITGTVGEDLSEMTTEHYAVESLTRSSLDVVSIVAKDLLKFADGDRAQAPAVSTGRIASAISDSDVSLELTPTGIGDEEYPASGLAALGGSEIVAFTRSGDTLTITRAQSNTEAVEHDEDEIVQVVLEYVGESPADIVYDLLVNYTGIDPSWCPLSEWKADIDFYIGRLYSAQIAIPTAVNKLLNELIEQTGLVMWWDAVNQKVRLKSLRPVTGARVISSDEMMADSFSFKEQPTKRASQIWTYFALRSPLEKLDDPQGYRSLLVTVDPDADTDYDQPAIRKVFSRWIAINNRPAASRLNSLLLSRYRDPPRKFTFDLFRTTDGVMLGQGLQLGHWSLQDEDGELVTAPVQVTSIEREEDHYGITAEEMLFTSIEDPDVPEGTRLIIIDNDSYNINLRTLHDTFYAEPIGGEAVLCIIEGGIKVGSKTIDSPSFNVGSWPSDVDITIRIQGRIQGHGGGSGLVSTVANGGPAFYTRYPVEIENLSQIWGGGGGGGSHFNEFFAFQPGGGGAGFDPGSGPYPGTTEAGNLAGGSEGGAGGGPGENGANSVSGIGGSAGAAIDGVSYVTFLEVGDIRGPQVN